ncbi:MAG: GTP 3',8-cyclase MoaA [Bacteroidota bacterium]
MLKDGFGRTHDYLRISLLDKCNFRCLYCLPHSPHNKNGFQPKHDAALMSADEIGQFAKAFVNLGVKKIRLTGGEPLVRKDAKDIIMRLSQLHVELTLTTNGMYVDEFLPTFQLAGINSVNISLDSLNAATFQKLTGRNEFERVKSNIQLLLDNNFHVKVNMVVMNGYNETEISAFVEWTRNADIHIRFIEFMPFPGNHWQPEKLITYKEILETINSNFPGVEKLDDGIHDTAKKFRVQNHAGTFAVISTMSEPFCGGCNRMRLTADGKMRNCLFSKTESDLLTSMRAGNDIEVLIKECLFGKHYMLGGHDEQQWATAHAESKERSMLAIGG